MNTPHMPGAPGRASLQSTTGRIAAVATALLLVLFLVLSVSRAAFTATTDNSGTAIDTGTVTLTDNDNGFALFAMSDAQPGLDTVRCIQVTYTGKFDSADIMMYADVTDTTPVAVPAPVPAPTPLAENVNITIESVDQGPNAVVADEEVVVATLPSPLPVTLPFDPPALPLPDVSCAAYDAAVLFGIAQLPDVVVAENEDYNGKLADFPTSYADSVADSIAGTIDGFAAEQTTRYFKITVSVDNDPAAAGKSLNWNLFWETDNT